MTFSTQLNSIIASTNQRRAAVLTLRVGRGNYAAGGDPGSGLPVRALEDYAARQPLVQGLGWAAMPLEWQARDLLDASAESVGHLTTFGQNIIGVSPGLFNASFAGYTVVPSELDPYAGQPLLPRRAPKERVLERLYSRRGSQGALLGAKWQADLGRAGPPNRPRDLLVPFVLRRNVSAALVSLGAAAGSAAARTATRTLRRRLSVEAFMGLAPLFSFSSFPSGSSSDMLVSLPTMARLLRRVPGATVTSVDSLRMEVGHVLFSWLCLTCCAGVRGGAARECDDAAN